MAHLMGTNSSDFFKYLFKKIVMEWLFWATVIMAYASTLLIFFILHKINGEIFYMKIIYLY